MPKVADAGHLPVLVERVVGLLAPALDHPNAVLVDATLGLAGHTAALLDRCPQARVVGLDRDPMVLGLARERLTRFGDRVRLVHAVYDSITEVVPDGADAVLFDLGVSSVQLDRADRGFSYAHDAPLDMRMDPSTGRTAADLLNTADQRELARILRAYGEERFAARIASSVVRARAEQPFSSSARLVDLVRDAIPAATRRTGGNPAKRTFQALRIAVNDELTALSLALPAALDLTLRHGRVVVLAYHSLEDRMVKQAFASGARADVPDDFPVVPTSRLPQLRLLTRGAERAGEDEVAANPRARSVRLRAVERIREAA
ncbi:16S rRNA (cytosine(1402)-N(4))-methyltransferase RsmH [soil metagenome]